MKNENKITPFPGCKKFKIGCGRWIGDYDTLVCGEKGDLCPECSGRPDKQSQRKGKSGEENSNWKGGVSKDKKKYAREYYPKRLKKNPDLNKDNYEKRKDTEEYKESHLKSIKKYDKNNPEKRKARTLAQSIPMPDRQLCEECNKELAIERHHPDYTKPDEVIFVCKRCHIDIHRKDTSKSSVVNTDNKQTDKSQFNLKVCIICGNKFKPKSSQLCCSDECKKERKKQKEQKYKEENLEGLVMAVFKKKKCENCKLSFNPKGIVKFKGKNLCKMCRKKLTDKEIKKINYLLPSIQPMEKLLNKVYEVKPSSRNSGICGVCNFNRNLIGVKFKLQIIKEEKNA